MEQTEKVKRCWMKERVRARGARSVFSQCGLEEKGPQRRSELKFNLGMGSWDGATSETGPTALLGPFLEGICHNPSAGQFCSVENTTFLHTTVSQTLHLKHYDAELIQG